MAVNGISRNDFDKFKPARTRMAELIGEEVEWFAGDNNVVIGVLTFDKGDKDWAFVVLGRDERGLFRAIDLGHSVETRDDARAQLIEKMEEYVASGKTVFPQGD